MSGGDGNDPAQLGDGDDRFLWNPGDDNDVVEGQQGTDVLDFNGSSVGEAVDVSAAGGRVRFSRDIANVVTDLDGVEHIGFDAARRRGHDRRRPPRRHRREDGRRST